MKKLFYISILLLLSWQCSRQLAQIPKTVAPVKTKFPEDWEGHWLGNLEIYNTKGKQQTVAMELEILKIDTSKTRYTCALIYGEDKIKGRRPYEMIISDAANGHFINDEKNTILMDEYLIGDVLYCSFAVEGNYLTSRFEKIGDAIQYEITVADVKPINVTGNQVVAGDTIPAVSSYKMKSVQKAFLKKKKAL